MQASNVVPFEGLHKSLEDIIGIQTDKKFRQKYYPPTVKRVKIHKRLTPRSIRGKRPTVSRSPKPDDDSGGDPDPSPKMFFLNCTVNLVQEMERGKVSTKIAKANSLPNEELDPRCRTSYLKVISALCNMKREIDPSSREASGILESQSQRDNLTLSHATIKNILREVEEIRKNRKSQ